MANIIKEFIHEIDFEKRETKTTTGNSINMTQGDVNAYKIKLIFAQSIAEIANVQLTFRKSDGTTVYDVAEKTSDTTAEYLMKSSLLDVDGQLTMLVSLVSSDYKLTYEAKIAYTVNKSFGDGDEVVDDDRFPVLETLLASVEVGATKNEPAIELPSDLGYASIGTGHRYALATHRHDKWDKYGYVGDYRDPDEILFVITTDDGYNDYTRIFRICKEEGVPLNPFVIPSRIGTIGPQGPYYTLEQLQEVKAHGGSVCSHSWRHLTSATGGPLTNLTPEEIDSEYRLAYEWLKEYGFCYDICANPGGAWNLTTKMISRRYNKMACPGTGGARNHIWDYDDPRHMTTYGGDIYNRPETFDNMHVHRKYGLSYQQLSAGETSVPEANLANWMAWLDAAKAANKGDLIVMIDHGYSPYWNSEANLEEFRTLIRYVKSLGIRIVSLEEAFQIKSNYLNAGDEVGKRARITSRGDVLFENNLAESDKIPETKTITLPTVGWYNILVSANITGAGNNLAELIFETTTSTPYCSGSVKIANVRGGSDINQLIYSHNSANKRIPRIRMVSDGATFANVAVYNAVENTHLNLKLADNIGWRFMEPELTTEEVIGNKFELELIRGGFVSGRDGFYTHDGQNLVTKINEIASQQQKEKTIILPTVGWWRFAKASLANIGGCTGIFPFTTGSNGTTGILVANTQKGGAGSDLNLLTHNYNQTSTRRLIKVRMITVADGNYCYLEFYNATADTTVNLKLLADFGWEFMDPESGDTPPVGATTNIEIDFENIPGFSSRHGVNGVNFRKNGSNLEVNMGTYSSPNWKTVTLV